MSDAFYDQLESTLQNAGSIITPAEAQGALCGILCQSSTLDVSAWMSFILDEQTQTDIQANQRTDLDGDLAELQEMTELGFNPTSGGMTLLLPSDDAYLQDRLVALSTWCEGFLYGIGIASNDSNTISDSSQEFITDIREIGQLDTESEDEDAEHYYMELVEYIRVGVLVFREEVLANATITPISRPNKTKH